ncbi:hypothetical protein FGO68_gene10000 [Halteria grandinella]|uniref:KIF-binding protein n=1 Tax=Halteria grandinella TaxID=5974 RepID=A0A8J8T559_HALGN|nr:hypothetical protein FGO68_gene10000 [Halteria grandinella]
MLTNTEKVDEPKIEEVPYKSSSKSADVVKFLTEEFQGGVEQAKALSEKMIDDESKPFEYKYQARKILQALNAKLKEFQSVDEHKQSPLLTLTNSLLSFKLGVNFFDCEEFHDAEKNLQHSLDLFEQLPHSLRDKHLNTLQDIYNHIGITHCNRGNHEKGMPYLQKASELYERLRGEERYQSEDALQSQDNAQWREMEEASTQRVSEGKTPLIIVGGFDKGRLEKNQTMTLFYLAQVHTKLGNNELAVQNCADTMQRQLSTGDYQLKDWSINCVNIAEYFIKNGHLAQAEYCLLSALAILPSEATLKKKLRATLQMQLARYYLERLTVGAAFFKEGRSMDKEKISKQFVEFTPLKGKVKEFTAIVESIKDFKSIEDAKTLFRLANTQFKRALEYFKLDGRVTEHVQMQQDVSKLYKQLSMLESEKERFIAMQERRVAILEPLLGELNPKAYEVMTIEMAVELADVYSAMFDVIYEDHQAKGTKPKQAEADVMNKHGENSIKQGKYAREIILKKEEKYDYAQAILNLTLSIARIYSKLYSRDERVMLGHLEQSFREYEWLEKFMKDFMVERKMTSLADLPQGMAEPFRMMKEMVELLPVKIGKLNAKLTLQGK